MTHEVVPQHMVVGKLKSSVGTASGTSCTQPGVELNQNQPGNRWLYCEGSPDSFSPRMRLILSDSSEDAQNVMRQGFAGMLWSKQFYHHIIKDWLLGDPGNPPPPPERKKKRNHEWTHLYNADVISMPDKWEYPWNAAWDLAFHRIPLALVDSDFRERTAHADAARVVHELQQSDL